MRFLPSMRADLSVIRVHKAKQDRSAADLRPSGINFELAQSNATDIGAGNAYTVRLRSQQLRMATPEMAFNSASTGASLVQRGAGDRSRSTPRRPGRVWRWLSLALGEGLAVSASATGILIHAVSSTGSCSAGNAEYRAGCAPGRGWRRAGALIGG